MANLTVGSGQQYSSIASAVSASNAGDTISVLAGTYTNDFATIRHDLTLNAVGGRVSMVATQAPPNGKAILTEGGAGVSVSITGFDFSGAQVPDGNGAGIRYEGGALTLDNTYFHDNQNGLLGGADPSGSITIRNSEFSHNGSGTGSTHNLYVGDIASLSVDSSYFHDAVVGHELKSRAASNVITNSRFIDGPTGTASYSIDLPNGGQATIANNVIEQGPATQNPTLIAFGEEGARGGSAITVRDNLIVNDLGRGAALWNAAGGSASFQNNRVYGFGGNGLFSGAVSESGTTVLSGAPGLNTASTLPAIGGSGSAPVTTPAAPAPAPDPQPQPQPQPSGNAFILHMSEDAWQGDASFNLSVDGQQRGTYTVTASHGAGASQAIDLSSLGLSGPHSLGITFINDAYGGPGSDRNLYVDQVEYDGASQSGGALWSNGTLNLAVGGSANAGTGLSLNLSQDAFQGDASFVLTVDGQQRGGAQSVTASHGAGASQAFDFGSLGLGGGQHDVGVAFVNDAYAGSGQDRNLFVDSLAYNGATQSGGALWSNGALHFTVG